MPAKKRGLGRGLNALITEKPSVDAPAASPSGKAAAPPAVKDAPAVQKTTDEVAISKIVPNPFQPRQEFDDEALGELSESIKALGVLQPLLVRKDGDQFQLIAGERRYRASQRAGLEKVPVRVLDIDDKQALEMALVENLQREDLDVIEEAEGYQRLSTEFKMTQEQIAERVGKGRTTVTNLMRLLGLPVVVRREIQAGNLSAGHAKALLGLKSADAQISLAKRIAAEGMSVRMAEQLASALQGEGKQAGKSKKPRAEKADLLGEHLLYVQDQLQQKLGTGIQIQSSKTLTNGKKVAGSIQIEYYSNDDLNRILDIIGFDESL